MRSEVRSEAAVRTGSCRGLCVCDVMHAVAMLTAYDTAHHGSRRKPSSTCPEHGPHRLSSAWISYLLLTTSRPWHQLLRATMLVTGATCPLAACSVARGNKASPGSEAGGTFCAISTQPSCALPIRGSETRVLAHSWFPTVYIHTYIVIETRVDNTNDLHNMPFNVVVRRLLRIDMASCGGDAEQRVHDDRGGFVQLHGLQEGTRDSAR